MKVPQEKNKQCITCHAGSRDAYQLSIALYEKGLLDTLVTDFYSPDLLSKYIKKRHSDKLPSAKVTSLWSNLIRQKLWKESFYTTDAILSRYALKTGLTNKDDFFLSSYTAYEAFSTVKARGLSNKCLLFQIHPHPGSIKKIFDRELELVPIASDSILGELEMNAENIVVKRLEEESRLADGCVVASSFTKETLMENNVPGDKITVIPYGVDTAIFPQKKEYSSNTDEINILFIGQMIQRKGLYYLLEAISLLNSKKVNLTIIGRGSIDNRLLENYISRLNITIKINLSHNELSRELHQADVLLFPSLVEGFGHVILEAMSSGVPVICTPNTAGKDLFITGNEGIIVPIRDTEVLAEKIEWCMKHKSTLKEMGLQAAETARLFTWDKFRKEIVQFYYKNVSA